MKKNWKYILFITIFLIIIIIIEIILPSKIDWSDSFSKKDKIPFGTFALHSLIETTVYKDSLKINNRSLYELFTYEETYYQKSNLLIITNNIEFSEMDFYQILAYVENGNNAFISAYHIDYKLLDTLGVKLEYIWTSLDDTINISLSNPKLKSNFGYNFDKSVNLNYYEIYDDAEVTVLGINEDGEPNFLKIPFGEGFFFIHNQPYVFTNYNLLKKDNYKYVFNTLSYLPATKTYWDEYFKPGNKSNVSPLNVIFKSRAFRVAYYILIIGGLCYMFLGGRREQRVIPIVKPLKNTSLEFIETIGRLYLHKRNHKDLALKKYKYFCEQIRITFFITTSEFSANNIEFISQKTGVKARTLEQIFQNIKAININSKISDAELYRFNQLIESFWKESM